MCKMILKRMAILTWRSRAIWLAAALIVVTSQRALATDVAHFNSKRAAELLQRPDGQSRALAYRACRDLGAAGKELYSGLLGEALAFHQQKIEDSIELASDEVNRFSGTLDQLNQQRQFALQFTLSEVGEDHSAMSQLRRAHGDAASWFKAANAQHARARASMGAINQSATAIDEIRRELAYCSGKVAAISQRTFHRVLSKHSTFASNLHDRVSELSAYHDSARRYDEAMAHNRGQTWASSEMRTFTDKLNEFRHALGLQPLRLEKRLSSACDSHTAEMVKLNYFAHRSPVAEHATPDKRAAKAKYAGKFGGENIYFYASPRRASAAFDAWWQSDSHRFVMFDPESDEIGLSNRTGTHWAMMTGTAPVRRDIRAARAGE